MSTYYVYEEATGAIRSRLMVSDVEQLADNVRNLPDGCNVIECEAAAGDMNLLRVDPESGQLIDFIPPAPEPVANYQWDPNAKSWELLPEVAKKRADHAAALERIETLERGQARALRETALNPEDRDARARLEHLDRQIAEQRAIVRTSTV